MANVEAQARGPADFWAGVPQGRDKGWPCKGVVQGASGLGMYSSPSPKASWNVLLLKLLVMLLVSSF